MAFTIKNKTIAALPSCAGRWAVEGVHFSLGQDTEISSWPGLWSTSIGVATLQAQYKVELVKRENVVSCSGTLPDGLPNGGFNETT